MAGDRHPAVAPSPKAVRSSRDRGCKGHRILRRVPSGGRHLGSFRKRFLSRGAVEGGLGVPSTSRPVPTLVRKARTHGEDAASAKAGEAGSEEGFATEMSEARSHTAPWEENAHAAASKPRGDRCTVHVSCDDPPKRSWGVVKRPVPRSFIARSQRLRGVSPSRKRRKEPGTREVRVHVIRLGGRRRFDASRVFTAGRSQGRSGARGR